MEDELTPDQLRRAIRATRKSFGVTQSQLAKEAGISQPAFSAYESGLSDLRPEQKQAVLKMLESVHKSQVGSILQGDFDIRHYYGISETFDESDPKTMRILADISQEELAKRAKVSRAKIRAWEGRSYYSDQTKWFDDAERLRVLDVLRSAMEQSQKKFDRAKTSAGYESFKRTQAAIHEAYGFAEMSGYHLKVVARYEKIIAILEEQIASLQQEQQLAPELRKKDARIADLEKEVSDLRALYDLGVEEALATEKAAVARAKFEELRQRVSIKGGEE